eukprot:CAMPEP_0119349182 /NCGR_PEP_ID=MMETSP1333-20130426/109422_1 /TAXON_ID=418940 /ORGANISM="Scyphosphaera apsteinii, Strain RCC1455" /LENGTH=32 /DNA_ID= /DNA_START= /DNA_END= /DNA_ORIENTATION=
MAIVPAQALVPFCTGVSHRKLTPAVPAAAAPM